MNGGNDGALELYSLYGVKQGVVDGNNDFMGKLKEHNMKTLS